MSMIQAAPANQNTGDNAMDEVPLLPPISFNTTNDDCLVLIFDHLNIHDLIAMCKVNKRSRSIIRKQVIGRRVVNFGELPKKRLYTFKLFGKHMTKIKINESDIRIVRPEYTAFDEFLSLIIANGKESRLIDLKMSFSITFSAHTEQLLMQAIPYFQNIANLKIHNLSNRIYDCNQLLNMFPLENLRSLELFGPNIPAGNWLRFGLQNLRHFRIGGTWIENFEHLKNFFEFHPNLKSFCCVDDEWTESECVETIARHVSLIEGIGYIQLAPAVTEWLCKLTKLNNLKIVSYDNNGNDLYQILDCVAAKHMITWMEILHRPIPHENVQRPNTYPKMLNEFTLLSVLHLETSTRSFDDFLPNFLPHLNSVTKVVLKGQRLVQKNVFKVMKMVKKLGTLVIKSNIRLSKPFYLKMIRVQKQLRKKRAKSQRHPFIIYYHERLEVEKCIGELGRLYKKKIIALKPY